MEPVSLEGVVGTLLLPPVGPLLLVALGLAMVPYVHRPGLAVGWTGLALAWILATPVVGEALLRGLEPDRATLDAAAAGRALAGPRPPAAVVVLGAGLRPDGSLEPPRERLLPRTLERLLAAARVARMTGLPVLVTGMRARGPGPPEGEIARRVLENELFVPVRWVVTQARDTEEAARLAAATLRAEGVDSVVLVTHAWHVPRARDALERAGLAVLPAPHGVRGERAGGWRDWLPGTEGLDATRTALRERLGLAARRWRSG